MDKSKLNQTFEFPKRNPVEYYQLSNPYAGSLWYSTAGEKGSEAIGKIQDRVKNNRKRNVEELILPARMESLSNKKVDSPIKNEMFMNVLDDTLSDIHDHEPMRLNIAATNYRRALEELIETEKKYHSDLVLINSIYRSLLHNSRKYKNILNQDEEAIIFGNIETVIDLSKLFIRDLLKGIENEAVGEFDEGVTIKKRIAMSKVENFDIGETFNNFLPRFRISYTSYFQNHNAQIQELTKCSNFSGPKVSKWLDECAFLAKSQSDCWNFESLLIKPVQRLSKYTLLIDALLDASCDDLSFEIIQHLCDSKAHLEKLLDGLNNISSLPSTGSHEAIISQADSESLGKDTTTFDPSNTQNKEYATLVKAFKLRYTKVQILKKEILYSLSPLVTFMDEHRQFAKSWQKLMEYGDNEKDSHFINSIYSSYIEKLEDQKNKTKLMVHEVKEGIVKALELSLEHCHSVKTKVNKHRMYRTAYLNYIEKERSKIKGLPFGKNLRGETSGYRDAQEYIVIENQINDEVPALVGQLDALLHYAILSYHRMVSEWLKYLAGEKQLLHMSESLKAGSWKLGNNFDIIELHMISKYHTKLALEEFSSHVEYDDTHPIYEDRNVDTTVKIYRSRVIRRLFGTF